MIPFDEFTEPARLQTVRENARDRRGVADEHEIGNAWVNHLAIQIQAVLLECEARTHLVRQKAVITFPARRKDYDIRVHGNTTLQHQSCRRVVGDLRQ